MSRRCGIVLLTVVMVVSLIPGSASGQTEAWKEPRTSDGVPDLQGVYTFRTITPMQRPESFEGKVTLSPEEAAAFETVENARLSECRLC